MLKCMRVEAILRMMKFDQLGILPYPAQVTVPILLLQEFVLQDRIQRADTNTLQRKRMIHWTFLFYLLLKVII